MPALSSRARIERVEHTPPTFIEAHQLDGAIEDDQWAKRNAGATLQGLMPQDSTILAAERIGAVCGEVEDIVSNGGRVVSRSGKRVSPAQRAEQAV